VIRAENRRVRQALLLQAKQAAVLWIQLEKKPVLNSQNLRNGRAVRIKPQHRIGGVAVIID